MQVKVGQQLLCNDTNDNTLVGGYICPEVPLINRQEAVSLHAPVAMPLTPRAWRVTTRSS